MSTTTGVTNSASQAQNSAATASSLGSFGSSIVKQEDFFKLLIAQLKNQDPMNPQDNQQFIGQLAQFSSLEQQTNQTKLLEQLVKSRQGDSATQALSMIGKEVTVENTSINYQPGDEIQMLYNTDSSASVPVTVTNAAGSVVYTDTVVAGSSGQHEYKFTGQLSGGATLPAGNYTVSFGGATDSEGNKTELPSYLLGRVDGVNFLDGEPVLMVNGQSVKMASVMAVYDSGTKG